MRCVVQRVTRAGVMVGDRLVGEIGGGLCVLLGVEEGDGEADARYCVEKIAGLRIFEDENGKMNLSVKDVGGAALIISQFTLSGDARHGRRPSFITAARPEVATPLYLSVARGIKALGIPVATGEFQAHMQVSLVNDGPVTILLDSKKNF